jgi:hypothetical protein
MMSPNSGVMGIDRPASGQDLQGEAIQTFKGAGRVPQGVPRTHPLRFVSHLPVLEIRELDEVAGVRDTGAGSQGLGTP